VTDHSPVLSAVDLARSFGDFRALDGVSVEVNRGQIQAIIGPNGAGKSTFLNVISGLLSPDRGEVYFDGSCVTKLPAHKRTQLGMARSFQITSIFTGLTVGQNVQIALMAQRGDCRNAWSIAGRRYWDDALALLSLLGLSEMAERQSSELAAGDRKRLEFAIALAADPKVLLLDEPTAGMSQGERSMVIEILRKLAQEQNIAVLFTEHDIEMVFENADLITVMHQGKLLAHGKPNAIRCDPRVQEVYLGDSHDA
jgi:branched-chain amino acid transport system ATP-binding protein